MQVIVPMSGFGERFRQAGYLIPKPLIVVEGKPIIQHVVELFPGVQDFTFVCNLEHLRDKSFNMAEILKGITPRANVIGIEPHKLGPVHAVLQGLQEIDLNSEVIVNYADFTCLWSFSDFVKKTRVLDADGAIPAYKGFHPHSGGSTNYAYIRESNGLVQSIREKQPFTDNKVEEYTSSGTYYFKNGHLMKSFMQEQVDKKISINGEFYVSSSMDLMAKAGLNVHTYEISHFMQWGTPQDLDEYNFWSHTLGDLSKLGRGSLPIRGVESPIILAAGKGERFKQAGYACEKPMLEVSGSNLIEQISKVSLKPPAVLSVKNSQVSKWMSQRKSKNRSIEIENITLGQAASAKLAIDGLGDEIAKGFTVFPCDSLFASNSGLVLPEGDNESILSVWVAKPSPYALRHPASFSWIRQKGDNAIEYALKKVPDFENALVMLGAFSFSSRAVFDSLYDRLLASGKKINGEIYLDSLVEFAEQVNVQIRLFEPNFSVSLGTPYEFETYRYWQACFDEWGSHAYSLNIDPFVEPLAAPDIRKNLQTTKHSPSEWSVE